MNRSIYANAGVLLLTLAMMGAAQAYDLHTKALVPITEKAKPAGGDMAFVKDGELRFCIVADLQAERACRSNGRPSISRAVDLLVDTFAKMTGQKPVVLAPSEKEKIAAYDYVLALGDQPLAREHGIDFKALPDQGFAIKTFEKVGGESRWTKDGSSQVKGGILIVGRDSKLIEGYSKGKLDCLGTSYATYWGALDFTERFLGCRYYFINEIGKIRPKCRDLVISPVWYEDAPYFRTRGNSYGIYTQTSTPKRAKHWEKYVGPVEVGKREMADWWRLGGTRPPHGKHYPDSRAFGKTLTEAERERAYYREPGGKLWYNPGNEFGSQWDPIRLDGFADIFCDAVRDYFASDGAVNPYGFGSLVNNTYVNFGVCDTFLPLKAYQNHPIVKAENLLLPDDIDLSKTEERGQMRNIYGRLYQYMGNRLKKECPGRTLYVLIYYNSLWAPTDPRWKLPDNVNGIVCDGQILTWALSPKVQERSRKLFGEWQQAFEGRPVSMAYLYDCGNPIARPFVAQNMGLVPKILGSRLDRDGIFFDDGATYHLFWGYYAAAMAQWNPDFDAVAATEEAFDLCCGKEAGAYLKEFYHILRPIVEERFMKTAKHQVEIKPDEADRLLGLIEKARAAVAPGTDDEKRCALICDWWPDAIRAAKTISAYKNPRYAVPQVADVDVKLDGVADEAFWKDAEEMAFMCDMTGDKPYVPTTAKLVWTEKGLFGSFETAEPARQNPKGDMWTNDTLEFFVSQGDDCAEWHQFAFDTLGRRFTSRKRELPIPQPADSQFKPDGFRFATKTAADKWTAEFFVPFDCLWRTAPKKGDTWRVTVVKTRTDEPKQLDATALTLGSNNRMNMYDIITFR